MKYAEKSKHPLNPDMTIITRALEDMARKYFPLNGVPASVVEALEDLAFSVDTAMEQFTETANLMICEINKLDGLELENNDQRTLFD